jgi:hypothetical protein
LCANACLALAKRASETAVRGHLVVVRRERLDDLDSGACSLRRAVADPVLAARYVDALSRCLACCSLPEVEPTRAAAARAVNDCWRASDAGNAGMSC